MTRPRMGTPEKLVGGALPQLTKLTETLQQHEQGLLDYFKHQITTAPLEGLNNKIKTLKRQAYGFRDNWYFKLRLLFTIPSRHFPDESEMRNVSFNVHKNLFLPETDSGKYAALTLL